MIKVEPDAPLEEKKERIITNLIKNELPTNTRLETASSNLMMITRMTEMKLKMMYDDLKLLDPTIKRCFKYVDATPKPVKIVLVYSIEGDIHIRVIDIPDYEISILDLLYCEKLEVLKQNATYVIEKLGEPRDYLLDPIDNKELYETDFNSIYKFTYRVIEE